MLFEGGSASANFRERAVRVSPLISRILADLALDNGTDIGT